MSTSTDNSPQTPNAARSLIIDKVVPSLTGGPRLNSSSGEGLLPEKRGEEVHHDEGGMGILFFELLMVLLFFLCWSLMRRRKSILAAQQQLRYNRIAGTPTVPTDREEMRVAP